MSSAWSPRLSRQQLVLALPQAAAEHGKNAERHLDAAPHDAQEVPAHER